MLSPPPLFMLSLEGGKRLSVSICAHTWVFVCVLEKEKERRVFSNYLVISSLHMILLHSLVQKSLGEMR